MENNLQNGHGIDLLSRTARPNWEAGRHEGVVGGRKGKLEKGSGEKRLVLSLITEADLRIERIAIFP